MRFTRLHMRPFGTFSDFELNFDKETGLHLVYGTNGAGKSTTLEALRSVLYGIAAKKKVHAASDLRIGARIEREGGDSLEFLRRTSTKSPLWNLADDATIPEEKLTPFLGNLERARFEMLFGLDHKTMVEGGQELLEGKGNLGKALFGAMLGGQQLKHVTDRLESERRSLYVDRSSKGRINELIKSHKSLKAELKQAALRPASHKEDQKRLKTARLEQEQTKKARDEARARAAELGTLRRSAAALKRLDERRRERAELGELRPLDEVTASRVAERAKEWESLNRRSEERGKEIHRLRESMAETRALVAPGVLDQTAAIEDLRERRSAYREAVQALKELDRQLERARAERDDAARRAGQADEPVGTSEKPTEKPSSANDHLESLSEKVEQLSAQLTRLDEARSVALEDVCYAEPKTQSAVEGVETIERRIEAQLSEELVALAPFGGTPLELRAQRVPAETEVERRADRERAEAATVAEKRADQQRAQADVRAAEEALERIAAGEEGAPPTTAEVQAARAQRDGLIRQIFDTKSQEPTSALDVAEAVQAADDLADRRSRESGRAAERDVQEGVLSRSKARVMEVEKEVAAAIAAEQSAQEAWAQSLRDLGLGGGLASMNASAFSAWAQRRATVLRSAQSLRDEAAAELSRAKAEEAERRARLKVAEAELEAAKETWLTWARKRGLDPDAGPAAALKQLRMLTDFRAADREFARLQREEAARKSTAEAFEKDVAELCAALQLRADEGTLAARMDGEEATNADGSALTEARLDALIEAARAAGQAHSRLEEAARRLKAEEDQAQLAADRAGELEASLEELKEAAGCSTREELLRVADLSGKARSLDQELGRIEAELRVEHGEAMDEEALREAIGDRSLEALDAAQSAAQEEASGLETKILEASVEEGSLKARLESTGSADAARIQSRLAEVESEMTEAVQEFLKVRLADTLLKKEIERHRQNAHGPLLARAEVLFRILTLGAYEKLHPSTTGSDKEIMVARRPSGRQVGVEEMSSGTRDQLYLALRVATVENMLQTIEPMPFIADDLFVNFDDRRTEAAFEVLAELSKSTQVIVFSHHESVVATARKLEQKGIKVDVKNLLDEHSRELARNSGQPALKA